MNITKYTLKGTPVTFVKTSKFKTITIELSFLGVFNQDVATKRSLLTRILSTSSKKYSTKKKLILAMYDLYDANFGVSTYPSYETSITTFHLSFVNEAYLDSKKNITEESIAFLNEFISRPNANKGRFNKKVFNEEANILKEKIDSLYNNKARYAFRKLMQHMSQHEIFSVSALGDIHNINDINSGNLYTFYQKMLQEETCHIHVIGDFDDETMLNQLNILPQFSNSNLMSDVFSNMVVHPSLVNEVIETQNVQQSRLCMGFRINEECIQDGFYTLALFNLMFGGMFTSDLVRIIREENSLAYSISSQTIPTNRLLIVSAGIAKDNYQMVKETVLEVLYQYQKGTMEESLFDVAKKALFNELREMEDSQTGIINHLFRNQLYGVSDSHEQMYQKIESVKLEDIQKMATAIVLDTIYFLTSE